MQYSFEHEDSQRRNVYENETNLEEENPLSKYHHTLTPMRLRRSSFPLFALTQHTYIHTTDNPHRVNKPS